MESEEKISNSLKLKDTEAVGTYSLNIGKGEIPKVKKENILHF